MLIYRETAFYETGKIYINREKVLHSTSVVSNNNPLFCNRKMYRWNGVVDILGYRNGCMGR